MGAKQITHLIFTDIETTAKEGPESRADQIIEIAAATVRLSDRAVVDQFETLILPVFPGPQTLGPPEGEIHDRQAIWDLGQYHLDAGHFRGVDWSTGMLLPDALDTLGSRFFQDGATIAGQNPRFDLDHIRRYWEVFLWPWPKLDFHVIDLCSPALFLVMAGKTQGVSLRNIIPWAYGEPNRTQAHRAMGDVYDTIRVFWAMFDFYTKGLEPEPWDLPVVAPGST